MKRTVLAGLALLLAGGIGAAFATGLISLNLGALGGSCEEDNEIATAQRNDIDKAAMAATTAALVPDAEAIYSMMTQEARSSTTAAQLAEGFKLIQSSGPYMNPKIVHTYFLTTVGGGADTHTVCGPLGGTEWVAVEVKPGKSQAHVLASAQTRNNDWAVTIWLLPEGNSWRVQYIHLGLSTMVGRSPSDLLTLARRQRDVGHAFNAAMLYAGARSLLDRGPAFQLGVVQALQEDASKFSTPTELQGQPPFVWKMKGSTFKVAHVTILGVDKKLGLVFDLPLEVWNGNDNADGKNRNFLDAFIATHSEYSPTFGFLVARAFKPDGSGGFSTVYEVGKGYD
jgi:hypothetical protein